MGKVLFYKPDDGWCGDFIPFWHDGRFYLYYLKTFRNDPVYGEGTPWYAISTTDFVHFAEHGEIIARGSRGEQDLYVFTGSAFYDGNQFHIFYTGHNPRYPELGYHLQGVMHAVGFSPLSYVKVPEDTFFAPAVGYEPHDWRDPFVFFDADSGLYTMLVAARLDQGPQQQRGVTALCISPDLKNWTVQKPLWSPSLYYTHECPDLFQMGDWWYLIYSEFTDQNRTRYVMSRHLKGPYHRPFSDSFDGKAYYAAKTCSDGTIRYLCGWCPSKTDETDSGDWSWGGNLVVHELGQATDGTLTVREPEGVRASFGEGRSILSAFDPVHAGAGTVQLDNSTGYVCRAAAGIKTDELVRLSIRLRYAPDTREFGVFLPVDDASDSGYYIKFFPDEQRMRFSLWPGNNGPVDGANMNGLDRLVSLEPNRAIDLVLLIDGTMGVAYVDQQTALTFRMYHQRKSELGLFAIQGAIQVDRLAVARPVKH